MTTFDLIARCSLRSTFTLLAALAALCSQNAHAAQYKITNLSALGFAGVVDVNNSGWVAGYTQDHGTAVFTGSSFISYGAAHINALNDNGVAVGYVINADYTDSFPAEFKNGATRIISNASGIAIDINNNGLIVGNSYAPGVNSDTYEAYLAGQRAWVHDGVNTTTINAPLIVSAINNSGMTTGTWLDSNGFSNRAYTWKNGTLQLAGDLGEFSSGVAINSQGMVAARYGGMTLPPCPPDEICGPVWESGTYFLDSAAGLSYAGHTYSHVSTHGLNDKNHFSSYDYIQVCSISFSNCSGDLEALISPLSPLDIYRVQPGPISDAGHILLYVEYRINSNNHPIAYYLLTPVPEPATYALMGMGLAGLSALRRRRKSAVPPN